MPGHVAGIDLGGTNMQIGMVDESGALVGRARDKTEADDGLEAVVERLVNGIHAACDDARIGVSDLAGVGVGAPAPIDTAHRVVINAVNLGWVNVPLADLMSKRLNGLFVTLDNDVNVAVWGEYCLGAARGFDDVLGMWIGTGIGGGLVLGGRLYTGTFGTAGEIGRGVIYPNVGRGSNLLEEHASRTAIVNTLRNLIEANHESIISDMVGGAIEEITIDHARRAIDEGDELTIEVAQNAARLVGIAAANAVTLLSLGCVILGGGVTESLGDRYVGWVRDAFDEAVFPDVCKQCAIRATALRDNAGVLGAALLARQRAAAESRS